MAYSNAYERSAKRSISVKHFFHNDFVPKFKMETSFCWKFSFFKAIQSTHPNKSTNSHKINLKSLRYRKNTITFFSLTRSLRSKNWYFCGKYLNTLPLFPRVLPFDLEFLSVRIQFLVVRIQFLVIRINKQAVLLNTTQGFIVSVEAECRQKCKHLFISWNLHNVSEFVDWIFLCEEFQREMIRNPFPVKMFEQPVGKTSRWMSVLNIFENHAWAKIPFFCGSLRFTKECPIYYLKMWRAWIFSLTRAKKSI